MTVISTIPDREKLNLTVVSEFEAPPERIWQVWEDPRQLEKWWGPPTWPATFEQHDFREGGESRYFMTGPEGERAHGHWRFLAIEGPGRLEIEDSFADENGDPSEDMPSGKMVVTIEEDGGMTRMTVVSYSTSLEALEQVLEMGQEEGMRQSMGQIDDLL